MTIETTRAPSPVELPPEEGGGPPVLQPWTLVVPGEGWEADLEHGAALPRIGEQIEFIADDGSRRSFVVEAVVHTVQHASSSRPRVEDAERGPNSIVNDRPADDSPGMLRVGLPRVVVA